VGYQKKENIKCKYIQRKPRQIEYVENQDIYDLKGGNYEL